MKKKTMVGLGLVAVAAVAVVALTSRGNGAAGGYRLVEIARGDVESTVSATGSLGAVSTVQVGTQVSGQVAEIHADFNDRVRKGQLVARIDPTLQVQAVRDAETGVARAQAELDQREFQFEQVKPLWEQRVLAETDYRTAEYNLALAKSSLASARTSLERAQRNLGYTYIYAPIDGTVIERNVDVGQTVAASFSAPQLFLIAEDLSRMQILVSVDESDIGEISEGQAARFTVQAYANETFTGVVKQVRLQSKTQENVVNYTVVVEVANPEGKLLPGMTATVDFILAQSTNVLAVPNAALRFRATEAMRAQVGDQQEPGASGRGPAGPDSAASPAGEDPAGGRGRSSSAQFAADTGTGPSGEDMQAASFAQLWYLDESGRLRVTRVRTGLTNGSVTEIEGPGIAEGMQVIAAVTNGTSESATSTNSANPFQSQQPQRGGGPPGPPPGGM